MSSGDSACGGHAGETTKMRIGTGAPDVCSGPDEVPPARNPHVTQPFESGDGPFAGPPKQPPAPDSPPAGAAIAGAALPSNAAARERRITIGVAALCVVGALFLGRWWGGRGPLGAPAGAASSSAQALEAALRARQSAPPEAQMDPMALGLDALYTRHDPATAAARFREVLAQSPQHYGATFQLATALDRAGDTRAARPLWEKMRKMAEAIDDTQTAATARARLAELDGAAPGATPGQGDLRPQTSGTSPDADPGAETMNAGLDALYTKHDPEAAAAAFRKVLAQSPGHYGATFQLATALDLAKKPAEARPLWERMLKMAEAIQDTKTADAARARLAKKP
jgi:tetratricopeptide (TPR) repeat protein